MDLPGRLRLRIQAPNLVAEHGFEAGEFGVGFEVAAGGDALSEFGETFLRDGTAADDGHERAFVIAGEADEGFELLGFFDDDGAGVVAVELAVADAEGDGEGFGVLFAVAGDGVADGLAIVFDEAGAGVFGGDAEESDEEHDGTGGGAV